MCSLFAFFVYNTRDICHCGSCICSLLYSHIPIENKPRICQYIITNNFTFGAIGGPKPGWKKKRVGWEALSYKNTAVMNTRAKINRYEIGDVKYIKLVPSRCGKKHTEVERLGMDLVAVQEIRSPSSGTTKISICCSIMESRWLDTKEALVSLWIDLATCSIKAPTLLHNKYRYLADVYWDF